MGASDDIKAETGQYDASLGQKSNETSGRAIMARQREGDNATYHYVDNLGRAIRHIGRVILDMIPAIYDTQRVARILGEDGEVANAIVDPSAPEAFQKVRDEQGEIKRIFNPNIGFYDVYTTSGPSFTTRRIEAVEAMTAMTQANPELWQVIGDQLVKNMDWPGAEEMAERLKLTLLPQVQQSLDKDEEQQVPPQIQQAMQQMEQQVQALQSAGQEVQGMLTEAQQKLQAETVARQKAEMKAQQADMRAQQSDMMLKIAAREEQAMNAVRQAQEGQEPKESAPAQPAQQPMVLPDVNGQLAGMMAPIAEVMQASQQGTQEALSVIAEQQANLGVLVQESSAQTAQLLATVVAEIAKPKTTTMQIKSPSGGVYTATKTEA
jgi:hypothetical protein